MSPLSRHRDGRAKTSKHARKVRHTNNDLRRQLRRMSTAGRSAYATLLAILAQKGGEIEVTQGTIDQVNQNFNTLSFVVSQKKDNAKEYVVSLVVAEQGAEPASVVDGDVDIETVSPGIVDAETETVSHV